MTQPASMRTMCPMNCHPTLCGMKVTVSDNKLIRIEGDPDNPDSRGFLCGRGRAAHEILDNPKRLTSPLLRDRRTNTDWREVTWDEAIDHMASKLKHIEPHEFGIWLGHGALASDYGTRISGQVSKRFAQMRGAQWWHPAMVCWALGGFGLGLTGVTQVNTKEDMGNHSDLIILWGANIASQPNTAPHIKAAKARGAYVVTIDVRIAEAAARADEVNMVKAGTDAALALAMMHVIIGEKLYDQEFVSAHTIGFEALAKHVEAFTPQWAQDQTGLQAEVITKLARRYATTRRACIVVGGSSLHKDSHGWQAARAIACLPALTGKVGIKGGGLGERHGGTTFGQGLNPIEYEHGNQCASVIPNQMAAMLEAFADGRVKALFLGGTNALSSFADSHALAKGLEKLDLIVCHDLFSSDTIREYADVVLPGTAWVEQLGCKMTHTHLYLMEKVLEPPAQCGSTTQIFKDLSTKLGLADFFPWDNDESMIDAIIDHPSTGHATVSSLRSDGGIRALNVSQVGHPTLAFDTPSGHIEFLSEVAQSFGLPGLPVYESKKSQTWPLAFRQGRTLNHFHAFYDHGQALPTLKKRGGKPTLWMAEADAHARGISNGDAIRVFNDRGSLLATAYVTDRIGNGNVWMRDGWRGINNLVSRARVIPDESVDLFGYGAGQSAYEAHVEVENASND